MYIPYSIDTQKINGRLSINGFLSSLPISAYFLLAAPALTVISVRNRPQDQFASVDSSAMIQIAFVFIAGLWIFHRLMNNQQEFRRLIYSRPVSYFAAILLLAGLSTLWSIHRPLTFYRFFEACVYLGLIIDMVLTIKDAKKCILIMLIYSTLVFIAFLTIWGPVQLLHGKPMILSITDNIAGVLSITGLFLCAQLLKRHQARYYLWFCFFIIVVVMTRSLATYISFLATSFLIILIRPFKQLRFQTAAFMTAGIIVLAGIWFGPSTVLKHTLFHDKTPQEIKTATGRTFLWQWYWENAITVRPFTGYGFEVGEHQQKGELYITNAHNTFVASAVCLGLPGAFLTVLLAGSMIYHAAKLRGPWGTALLAAVICSWINALSIPSMTSRVRESWIIMVFLCVLIAAIKCNLADMEDGGSNQIND